MRIASFHTRCAECGESIPAGAMIEQRCGEWVHAECPDDTGLTVKPGELICSTCQMIHKGECL